jgi:hypothetical protein
LSAGVITGGTWQNKRLPRKPLFASFPELGGDPAKGKVKHLIIGYRLDGTPKVAIFDELRGRSIPVSLP